MYSIWFFLYQYVFHLILSVSVCIPFDSLCISMYFIWFCLYPYVFHLILSFSVCIFLFCLYPYVFHLILSFSVCIPFDSVCIRMYSIWFSLYQFGYNLILSVSVRLDKQAGTLFAVCSNGLTPPQQCMDSNTLCLRGICSCAVGFYPKMTSCGMNDVYLKYMQFWNHVGFLVELVIVSSTLIYYYCKKKN